MDDFNQDDWIAMQQALVQDENSRKFSSKYWSPSTIDGVTKIRFLPPKKQFGETLFFERHRIHYVNGRSYYCLHQTLMDKNGKIHEAEECPFCKKASQLWKMSSAERDEYATMALSVGAKDRYVSRVIVRGKKNEKNEDAEAIPVFYEYGKKIFGMLADAIKLGEAGNFLSMLKGRDFNLVKKGIGRSTDYSGSSLSMNESVIFSGDNAKESIQTMAKTLENMKYNQLVEFTTYQEMESALKEALADGSNDPVASFNTPKPIEKAVDPLGTNAIFGIGEAVKPAQTPASTPVKEAPKSDIPDDIESLISQIDQGIK